MQHAMTASMATVLVLLAPTVSSHLTSTLPQCWQTCVTSSGRGLGCPENDLDNCLCSSTSTPLLDNLLYCVRTACDTTTDPALLTDPLQSIQTACKQTAHTIPDTAAASASAAAHDAVLDQELKRRNVLAARTSMGAGPASTPANSIPTAGGAVTGTDGAPMATYTPTDAMPSYYISTTDTALTSSSTQKNSASSGGSDAGTLLDMSSGSASKNAKGLLRLTVGVLVCMIAWF